MLQVIDISLASALFCLDHKGPDPLLTDASRCHFLIYLDRESHPQTTHYKEGDNEAYRNCVIFTGILLHNKALQTAYTVWLWQLINIC